MKGHLIFKYIDEYIHKLLIHSYFLLKWLSLSEKKSQKHHIKKGRVVQSSNSVLTGPLTSHKTGITIHTFQSYFSMIYGCKDTRLTIKKPAALYH